jgi:hypothetical protein
LLVYIQQRIHSQIYASSNDNDLESFQAKFSNETIKNEILTDLYGQFSLNDFKALFSIATTNSKLKQNKNETTKFELMYDELIKTNLIDSSGYLIIENQQQLNDMNLETSLLNEKLGFDIYLVRKLKTCFSIILSRERSIELPINLRRFVRIHLDEFIDNCKQAFFMEPNTGYVVDLDRTSNNVTNVTEPLITIIDSNTGADLATSQWSGGLHQFLQLKHACRLSALSLKAVFVSNVAYLKRYERINGLSGTLGSVEESKTLIDLYNTDLIVIPPNKQKIFFELVPLVSKSKNEWISNIYKEICQQISVHRSVLLICEDIKQLDYVYLGIKRLYDQEEKFKNDPIVNECFTTLTIYKREHDEFNFEDEQLFEPHRLIIATNLAGRGTDIKLSENVIKAGGMHVIIAFMPKNSRIEEQAFGRAAR